MERNLEAVAGKANTSEELLRAKDVMLRPPRDGDDVVYAQVPNGHFVMPMLASFFFDLDEVKKSSDSK